MCGLSVIVDFGSGHGLAGELFAMHAQIPHRGPDGEGFCALDGEWRCHDAAPGPGAPALRAGMAFRWLQIQDRSPAAAQPMASSDGSARLLFNGEIYNFRELRAELEGLGHSFRSRSDTEVVLAAWLQWGTGMFERLDGMWAIVLLDLASRRLVTSRDRFGIKPLFYTFDGQRLRIASEVKQLLAAGIRPQANAAAVRRFIRGARPATPEQTFFAAVSAHPAATYCEVDLRGAPRSLRFVSYWALPPRAADNGDVPTLDAACDRLDELFAASVAEHMVSVAPVGILVSGGLDSSIVAALSKEPFTSRGESGVGFSMVLGAADAASDERRYMERIISELGFRGHTTELDPGWLKSGIAEVTRAQEEPVAGIAVAGQYLTLQLAASTGVRVVLDGQGADELFGGYPRHQFALLRDCLRRRAWGRLAAEAAAMLARDRSLLRAAWISTTPRRTATDGADFVRDEAAAAMQPPATLDETLRRDLLTGNLRAVLALTDRNSMAHSIEARVPYVHRAIVEFAFSLPDGYKVGAGRRKRILRKMGARHVPREIVGRSDRVGFSAPTRRWLLRDFGAELRALAEAPAYRDSALVDHARLRRYVEGFLAGRHADAGTIWRLYAIDQWARAYSVAGI